MKKPLRKRWWFKLMIALFALAVLLEAVLFTLVAVNASRYDAPGPADVIVVLGARIEKDATVTPALGRRLTRAYELYAGGYAEHIIVCGAQGDNEPETEAAVMKRYLVEQGVPEANVIEEDRSYSTMENLQNAKAIMEARGFGTAMIVSSDYHLWRAMTMCRDIGLNATSSAGSLNAETLHWRIRNCVRETLSWVKYTILR